MVQLTAGSTLVAALNDSTTTPLIAVKGRVVALNANPFSSDSGNNGGWNSTASDGTRLLANLLLFKGTVQPTCTLSLCCDS